MIPPYGKYFCTVTGGHRGGGEVRWRHCAANCRWWPLRAPNPSSRIKPCNFAGKKGNINAKEPERPGISAGVRDTGGVKWKTSCCRENREPPMLQRDCLPARTLIPPSRTSIITKWDFPLIGARAKKKCSIKKARGLSTQLQTCMHSLAHSHRRCPQLLRVHKSKACDGN